MSRATMTGPATTAGADYDSGAVLYDTPHGGLRCASAAPDEVTVEFGYTGLPAGKPFVLDGTPLIGQLTVRRFARTGGAQEWRVRREDAQAVLGERGGALDTVARHLALYLAAIAEDFLTRDDIEALRITYLTNRTLDELAAIDAELSRQPRSDERWHAARAAALTSRRQELLALIEALIGGENPR